MKGTISLAKQKQNGTGIINAINQNNTLIIAVFFFLLGLLIGILVLKHQSSINTDYYSTEFKSFYSQLSGGFLSVLRCSVLQFLPFVSAIFLSGTCMVGAVLVPAIIIIRGTSLGLVMGYVYAAYGLMGVVFNLLILIPPAIISTLALILSAREAFGFSLSLARLAIPNITKPLIDKDFKLYCLRQIFVLLFFFAAALVQTLMCLSFMPFFNL